MENIRMRQPCTSYKDSNVAGSKWATGQSFSKAKPFFSVSTWKVREVRRKEARDADKHKIASLQLRLRELQQQLDLWEQWWFGWDCAAAEAQPKEFEPVPQVSVQEQVVPVQTMVVQEIVKHDLVPQIATVEKDAEVPQVSMVAEYVVRDLAAETNMAVIPVAKAGLMCSTPAGSSTSTRPVVPVDTVTPSLPCSFASKGFGMNFQRCPDEFWEALYEEFEIDSFTGYESDGVSDEDFLEVTWLPLGEFVSRFVPLMTRQNVLEYYSQSGIKDFDEGRWYRIRLDTKEGQGCNYVPDPFMQNSFIMQACDFRRCPTVYWQTLYTQFQPNHRGLNESALGSQFWDQVEIEVWIKVTFKQLQSMPSSRQRQLHMKGRWDAAVEHIPVDIREPVKIMLDDALEKQATALRY